MSETYHPDRFLGPRRTIGLSYWLSRTGNAIIETDHGIVLNSFLPPRFVVNHVPDLPLSRSAVETVENGNVLKTNLDQAIRTGGYGRAVLAHEFGHGIGDDPSLLERRDRLYRQIRQGDLPHHERLPAINALVQTDIACEVNAWDTAVDIAVLMGTTQKEFERMRTLALQTYYYGGLKRLQKSVNRSVKPQPDKPIPVFDPRLRDIKQMTLPELSEAVHEAKVVYKAAAREMAAVLREENVPT